MKQTETGQEAPASPGRRDFIKKSGRFAAAAPAVAFLLSTSLASEAVARSGGGGGGYGGGGFGRIIDTLFSWLGGR